jgi:hypothetical protein
VLGTFSGFAPGTLVEFTARDKKGALGHHMKALDVSFQRCVVGYDLTSA